MGMKENFTKALRELTGDKEADKNRMPAEELEKAVEAYDSHRVREITQSVEKLEKAVEAYDSHRAWETTQNVNDTPASKASFNVEDSPPTLFTQTLNQSAGVSPAATESVAEPTTGTIEGVLSNAGASPAGTKPATEPAVKTSEGMLSNVGASPAGAEPATEPAAKTSEGVLSNVGVSSTPTDTEPVTEPTAKANDGMSSGAGEFVKTGEFGATNANTGASRPVENFAARVAFSSFHQKSEDDDTNEVTIISKNTVIDGNIRSFADMSIDGDIRGDVETTKNIELNGKIVGNIACNNAFMHKSQIQGSLRMKGNLNMKRETLLIGDLVSTYAEINGKIKGNIDVAGKAELRGDAVVFGDINASTITVEDGAIIQGRVNTMAIGKEGSKNLFPEMIVIGDN